MQLRRLHRKGRAPRIAGTESHNGAFLFIDLVSFTKLGEQLRERGLKGAEVMSDILNAYFQPILSTIYAHGGDVLFFAGDAIGIIWLAENDDRGKASLRAAQCGLAIQELVPSIKSPWPEPLAFRASLGVGPVQSFEVGGVDGDWKQLVRGPAIDLACTADKYSSGGILVMSEHSARHLAPYSPVLQDLGRGFVQLKSLGRPLPKRAADTLPITQNEEKALGKRLMEAEHRHLYSPSAAVTAEFRRITVLFADIPTTNPETLQTAVEAVQKEVNQFHGVIYQLQEDDKGTGLVIAFGLPGAAHADDPVRALMLSKGISKAFEALGIAPRLGIATGTTFCGPLGTSERQQYSILGSTVNLAARLMSLAEPGQTYCDAQTRKLAEADFVFEEAGSTTPKGFSESVPIYRPGARSGRLGGLKSDIELVGRTAELEKIVSEIDSVAEDGTSHVLMVRADPGIGKSALLQKAHAIIEQKGLLPVTGATDPFETETAYFAFRNIARHWCGIEPTDTDAEGIAKVTQSLVDAPDLQPLIPLLGPVIGLDVPENEVTEGLRGQVRSENTQRILLHLARESFTHAPAVLLSKMGTGWTALR